MNWDRVKGEFKQISGTVKQKWAKLTDDDLALLTGKKEVFLGKLQERYGLTKEDAERQLDELLDQMTWPPSVPRSEAVTDPRLPRPSK